ncbi:MAG TPA: peptidoglycan DD-metalloendopeptidase family protein [Thermoanaerobaculia bacterium]|nr:peptidoglycan DD-metalloendopeptidase family protein [Thermoanaerobaculia bacterium]
MLALIFVLLLGATETRVFEIETRSILQHVVARDFAAATKNFDASIAELLSADKFKALYETQISPQIGAFVSAGDATVEKVENGLTVVTLATKFEKSPINFVVSWNADGKVVGLWFKPPEVQAAPTRFADYQTKSQLQLPFDGEWYVFWGGRTLEQNYHAVARDQRFAYDLVIRRKGFSHSGKRDENASYFCWDQPIYAPAAGTVTESVDGVEDNKPGVMNPSAPAGNHLVIDHGNGEYSLLAHFRKGTVVPKVGADVKQGQLVGRCGNSGNSSEPHLHYHLQNAPKYGEGDGLPAQFTNYTANGAALKRGEPVRGERIKR